LSWTHNRASRCSCIIQSSKEYKMDNLEIFQNKISNKNHIFHRRCSNNHRNLLKRCIPYKTPVIQWILWVDTPDLTYNLTSQLPFQFQLSQTVNQWILQFLSQLLLHSKLCWFSFISRENISDYYLFRTPLTATTVSYVKEVLVLRVSIQCNLQSYLTLHSQVLKSISKTSNRCILPN